MGMSNEELLKNHYAAKQRAEILCSHLGASFYHTGELHDKMDAAMLEYSNQRVLSEREKSKGLVEALGQARAMLSYVQIFLPHPSEVKREVAVEIKNIDYALSEYKEGK